MSETIWTDVVIVGGGPAGATLGLLLAKEGVDVLVVERSSDYRREFRGKRSRQVRWQFWMNWGLWMI